MQSGIMGATAPLRLAHARNLIPFGALAFWDMFGR